MCCILFVVLIQSSINSKSAREAEIRDGLGTAISQTMREVMEQDSVGINNEETLISSFVQSLLMKVSSDVDLKVRVISLDMKSGLMDVEVQASYDDIKQKKKTITIRRTVIFDEKK
jgi:hypothetical protein